MADSSEFPQLLAKAGFKPRVARALAWMIQHGGSPATCQDIEIGTGMRQSETQNAVSILAAEGWIKNVGTRSARPPMIPQEVPAAISGRPAIVYQLSLTRDQIFTRIRELLDKQAGDIAETTEQIRKAIFSSPAPAVPVMEPAPGPEPAPEP